MRIPNPYAHGNPLRYAIVPILLIAIALGFIFLKGIPSGIDLRGGLLLTIQTDGAVDVEAVKANLAPLSAEVSVRKFQGPGGGGIEIELVPSPALEQAQNKLRDARQMERELLAADSRVSQLEASTDADAPVKLAEAISTRDTRAKALQDQVQGILTVVEGNQTLSADAYAALGIAEKAVDTARGQYRDKILAAVDEVTTVKGYTSREIGSSLSKFFFSKTREIVTYAFILAAIVVFVVFRAWAPSLAVIFGASADIIMTLGGMSLLGIPLSLASVAAILMLIGLSLDTDVMLTMRILKRTEGTARERAFEAMKTGVLMNLTTIVAFGVLTLIALWLGISTYWEIGTVVVLGGIFDFFATWMFNAPLVLRVAEKREKGVSSVL